MVRNATMSGKLLQFGHSLKTHYANLSNALLDVGYCYDFGVGCAVDAFEATKWYIAAGELDNPVAQFNLGINFENVVGVRVRNIELAARWYMLAAEQGLAVAECNLGGCYEHGDGVAKDLARAAELYRSAAIKGSPAARYHYGVLLLTGGCGIAKDVELGLAWLHKSSAAGGLTATYRLGTYYEQEHDMVKAKEFFLLAAQCGYTAAQRCLARIFEREGKLALAARWYSIICLESNSSMYLGARNDLQRLKRVMQDRCTG